MSFFGNVNQGFPQINSQFVDQKTGRIRKVWMYFLLTLLNRTGGVIGINSFDAQALSYGLVDFPRQDQNLALEGLMGEVYFPRTTSYPLNFVIDGGAAVILPGVVGDVGPWPFDIRLRWVSLLADQVGSIQLDFWVASRASYPPTVANTITAAAKPAIVANDDSLNTTLVGWTTLIKAGSTLRVNVDSCVTIQRVGVSLEYTR